MKDIKWVNTIRAIGICLVYMFHVEVYSGFDIKFSYYYKPFFMAIFFFVSGYLFFNPNKEINIKDKIRTILTKQLWPYFIFCSLMFFPKFIVRGADISLTLYFQQIFLGKASWFIAALIVLQLIILAFYKWIKKPEIWGGVGVILSMLAIYLFCDLSVCKIWYFNSALCAMPIYALGGLYRNREKHMIKYAKLKLCVTFFVIYFILLLMFDSWIQFDAAQCPNYLIGYLTTIISSLAIVALSQIVKTNKLIDFVGRNTFPLYFLSGGLPLIISRIAKHFLPDITFVIYLILCLISFSLAIILTYFIKSKLYFMLDFSEIAIKR